MPERLRIALIGAGHMGKFHAQAIADSPDARLAVVCDIDAARAAAIAQPHGAEVETNVAALPGRIDAAVIAAATSVHKTVALPLLAAGVPLLIEKPLAPTAAEAREIVDAAARAGVPVQVGQILRFDPVTRAIAGRPLAPRFMEVIWAAPFSGRSMDVGVVMDVMIHGIDLVLHLAGSMPTRIDAVGGIVIGPHEDFVNVRLEFAGGIVANLSASRLSRSRQRLVRIFTPDAFVRLDYQGRSAEWISAKPGIKELARAGQIPANAMDAVVSVEKLPIETTPDALRAQLAAFISSVRGHSPVAVSAEDGARAVEVAEKVIQAVMKQ